MGKTIIPFVGVGEYTLLSSEKAITDILVKNNVSYCVEIWDNAECTVQVPWTVIKTEESMWFFLAKDKLFKIYLYEGFEGTLRNGISIGIDMSDARRMDPTLRFDDWNEDWASDEGYWLSHRGIDNQVVSIVIFIKEALDDDLFEKYEW